MVNIKKQAQKMQKQMSQKAKKVTSSRGVQLVAGTAVAATSYYVFEKGVDVASTALAELMKDGYKMVKDTFTKK